MDPHLKIFPVGAAGSASVEVLRILALYERGRAFPARYKKKGYWFFRSLLALVGGLMAILYDVQSAVVAFHIGASAPVMLYTFSRNPPETGEPDKS